MAVSIFVEQASLTVRISRAGFNSLIYRQFSKFVAVDKTILDISILVPVYLVAEGTLLLVPPGIVGMNPVPP